MTHRLPTVGGDNGAWGAVLNDYLGQAHNSDGSLKHTREITVTPPTSWLSAWGTDYADVLAAPITITLPNGPGRPFATLAYDAASLFDSRSTARSAPGATYYVSTTGSDSNDGISPSTPFLHIWKAVTVANAGGVPTKIIVLAGNYYRSSNPWNNGSGGVSPTVDIAFLASGGRVATSTSDAFSDPSLDGTQTNCYAITVSQGTIDRVVDTANLDRFGKPTELVKRSTAALANATPGSWAQVSGTLYIRRIDDTAVTKVNTHVYRTSTSNFLLPNPVNIFIGGVTDADTWLVDGGDFNGPINAFPSAGQSTLAALVLDHVTLRNGGGIVNTGGKGFAVDSWHGLAAAFRSHAEGGWTDGWNYHNSHSNMLRWLLVNCTDSDNGRGTSQSCNGITSHDDVVGAALCCYSEGDHGGTYRHIGTSKTWVVAPRVKDDFGDIAAGGSVLPTAFRVDDTAEMWIEADEIEMRGGGIAHDASAAGSAIHLRNPGPTHLPDRAIGTVDTY